MSKIFTQNDSFWESKRVLITGHTGFKGSWLSILLLAKGANIYGLSLPPEANPSLFNLIDLQNNKHEQFKGEFNSFLGDINKYKLLKEYLNLCKPEIIFHLAAQPLVQESYLNPLKTWETNLMGSLNLLESVKSFDHHCSLVMVTTDKVYKNNNWVYGYRECDELGGNDPYSASKAAMEIAVSSWRKSFCGNAVHQKPNIAIASARAGNVIGGGDWARNRIIPDAVRGLSKKQSIIIRNPLSTRPWQHVLEPLEGYLKLAKTMHENLLSNNTNKDYTEAFNFGPNSENNQTVSKLLEEVFKTWEGKSIIRELNNSPEEENLLNLVSNKAKKLLNWESKWGFKKTVANTINWYKDYYNGKNALNCCLKDINNYLLDK